MQSWNTRQNNSKMILIYWLAAQHFFLSIMKQLFCFFLETVIHLFKLYIYIFILKKNRSINLCYLKVLNGSVCHLYIYLFIFILTVLFLQYAYKYECKFSCAWITLNNELPQYLNLPKCADHIQCHASDQCHTVSRIYVYLTWHLTCWFIIYWNCPKYFIYTKNTVHIKK